MASRFLTAAVLVSGALAQSPIWGQCGGAGWQGPTTCVSGSTCIKQNDWYYQCMAGSNGGGQPSTTTTSTSSVRPTTSSTSSARTTTTSQVSTRTSTSQAPTSTADLPPITGRVEYAGINIAGFDFGCTTDGTCNTNKIYPALKNFNGQNNHPDGVGQMQHFTRDNGMNMFRLPVGWQYLVNNRLGGTLDANNLAKYDELMQACLSLGGQCIIDIHNYARWNGGVVGQGGPTNEQFVSLWTQLATKYASNTRVWFGIMNEPHDININTWAQTVQAVVTAIRAVAPNNYITLPGNDWQSAGAFISGGSAAALSQVKNPDGSTTKLIFDVHKYLDFDNSGTHTECTTNNIDQAFAPLAAWLRQNKRRAILTESGGGNTASCQKYFCEQIKFLNQNSDVYIGYTGWSAGSFDNTYELVMTPTWNGNSWTDKPLTSCLAR